METKDQQIKHVVIGMALGVLAQDVTAVTSNKMSFEFAFDHAWWTWPQATQFPSIAGHGPGNLFWLGVHRSEGRKAACAAWETGQWNSPYIRYDSWSVDECLDLHADTRASMQNWRELGRLFVAEFKPDEVQRS